MSTSRDGNIVFNVGSKKLVLVTLGSGLSHGDARPSHGRWLHPVDGRERLPEPEPQAPIKQIVFAGEPFTALNLHRFRDNLASITTIPGSFGRLLEQKETKATKVVLLFVTFVAFCPCIFLFSNEDGRRLGRADNRDLDWLLTQHL